MSPLILIWIVRAGHQPKKESIKVLEEICSDMDLINIWRIRNPDKRLFT